MKLDLENKISLCFHKYKWELIVGADYPFDYTDKLNILINKLITNNLKQIELSNVVEESLLRKIYMFRGIEKTIWFYNSVNNLKNNNLVLILNCSFLCF